MAPSRPRPSAKWCGSTASQNAQGVQGDQGARFLLDLRDLPVNSDGGLERAVDRSSVESPCIISPVSSRPSADLMAVETVVSKRKPPRSISPCVKDRKSTRLNSSHVATSYAVFCLKKKT